MGVNLAPSRPLLTPPFPKHIKDEAEHHAQQDGGREREVEGCVLAAIDDVARQPAQGQVSAAKNQEQDSGQDQRAAEDDEKFTEIRHD